MRKYTEIGSFFTFSGVKMEFTNFGRPDEQQKKYDPTGPLSRSRGRSLALVLGLSPVTPPKKPGL